MPGTLAAREKKRNSASSGIQVSSKSKVQVNTMFAHLLSQQLPTPGCWQQLPAPGYWRPERTKESPRGPIAHSPSTRAPCSSPVEYVIVQQKRVQSGIKITQGATARLAGHWRAATVLTKFTCAFSHMMSRGSGAILTTSTSGLGNSGVLTAHARGERSLNVMNPVELMVAPTTLSTTSSGAFARAHATCQQHDGRAGRYRDAEGVVTHRCFVGRN